MIQIVHDLKWKVSDSFGTKNVALYTNMRFDNTLFGGNSQNVSITPILNNGSIEI